MTKPANVPAAGASADVARRVAPHLVTAGIERLITADQTNHSVVVDEHVIVKWFTPPVPDPHLGTTLLERLRTAGFAAMPKFHGIEVREGSVVAMVSEFIPGAVDGWEWFVDEISGWIDGEISTNQVRSSAIALGELAAGLHRALADDPLQHIDAGIETGRWMDQLDEALDLAQGAALDVLRACEADIREMLTGTGLSGSTPAINVHGDLHVGQILRIGDQLIVIDFDGNPLLETSDRHRPRPAAVDVASLIQSVDHAGRVAQRRRPDSAACVDSLIATLTRTTLDAYRAAVAAGGLAELLDERLLRPLQVAQELHELVYAAQHLPRWAYAPTATLRAMFPSACGG